jgi:hypothetical protein
VSSLSQIDFVVADRSYAGGKALTTTSVNIMTNASNIYQQPISSLGLFPDYRTTISLIRFRGLKMNLYTVRFFAKAIKFGSKYVYQTVPRLLTIWLDLGENGTLAGNEAFKKLNEAVAKAIKETPIYKVRVTSPSDLTVI